MLLLLKSKIVYIDFFLKMKLVIRFYFELPQQCSGTVVRYIRINPALNYLYTAIV